jgi:hypothetical protein
MVELYLGWGRVISNSFFYCTLLPFKEPYGENACLVTTTYFNMQSLLRKFMEEAFVWLYEEKKWTCELKKER